MTGDDGQAEDLTQEVFLRALRSLPSNPDLRERAWLFRTARNLLLNLRRDQARRPSLTGFPEADAPPHGALEITPAAGTEALELERALADLERTDREVFFLREIGGLSYEEISSLCDITPDAVRSRIYRARVALRAALSEGFRRCPRRPSTEVRP